MPIASYNRIAGSFHARDHVFKDRRAQGKLTRSQQLCGKTASLRNDKSLARQRVKKSRSLFLAPCVMQAVEPRHSPANEHDPVFQLWLQQIFIAPRNARLRQTIGVPAHAIRSGSRNCQFGRPTELSDVRAKVSKNRTFLDHADEV